MGSTSSLDMLMLHWTPLHKIIVAHFCFVCVFIFTRTCRKEFFWRVYKLDKIWVIIADQKRFGEFFTVFMYSTQKWLKQHCTLCAWVLCAASVRARVHSLFLRLKEASKTVNSCDLFLWIHFRFLSWAQWKWCPRALLSMNRNWPHNTNNQKGH